MYIVGSWRDSLSILAPSNLKLFLLVTLKSTLETYKILFTHLVPIVVMLSMVGVTYLLKIFQPYMQDAIAYGPAAALEKYGRFYLLFFMLQFVFLQFFLYVTYAATRPSVGIKNDAYFLRFWKHFCVLMLVQLAIFAVCFLIGIGVLESRNYAYTMYLLMNCVFNVIILFFLDSDGSVRELCRSVVRAFTVIVYNLPLMSILFALEIGGVFVYQSLGFYETWWLASVPFILSVCMINIYTNFYIKKTHEQPDLYFDLPE